MFVRGASATTPWVACALVAAAIGCHASRADETLNAPTAKNPAPIQRSAPSNHALWPAVDEAQVRAAGIRKLESRRLVLYTDLPSEPAIDELPQVFDQAVDLWCKHFGLDPAQHGDWRMRASLMDDPSRFAAAGLVPDNLPKFFNGYTLGRQCWVKNQSSPYYRRHLLLHEGVHGLMFATIGANAPPWYLEGMAELLATHRWQDGKLELPPLPARPEDVPKLGRIEIVQHDVAAGKAKSLGDVMAYDAQAHLQVEPYGWSWAAAAFLDGHPRYRERFRNLQKLLAAPNDFNARLREVFADDARGLADEWQAFISDIDYGFDFDRTAIDFAPGKPLAGNSARAAVQADRGWQNSGVRLEAGKKYRLAATGRYQVANDPKPWFSEPQGVSIRYVHGKPLGLLLAAVRPDNVGGDTSAFSKPIAVGRDTTIEPAAAGTLYLKINDSAGQLRNNAGHADVEISSD